MHHHNIINNEEINRFDVEFEVGFNYTIFLSKTSKQYLSRPYGKCSNYDKNWRQPFGAHNYIQCYRKCIQFKHKTRFDCIPLIIDNFITELDFDSVDNKVCSFETFFERQNSSEEFQEFCVNKCPKDCFKIEYYSEIKKSTKYQDNQHWFDHPIAELPPNSGVYREDFNEPDRFYERPVERRIVWDTSKPMFAYIDEPVLTFTAYLVYCGGLMCLWFGKSIEDFIKITINMIKTIKRKIAYIISL